MKIRLTINGKAVIARLNDTATARELAAQLPLTLPLEDYAATEKITYLPKKLSTAGAPAGFDPSVGDITYYAPWGNLAIFYKDFGYSQGLISLGQIETGLDVLEVQGPAEVVIERID
ncbi:cyclophilin-like fold protein [Denitromonas sp.]|uniref:cyclophilin-like fold protein n=1 Tax=Denitromonas sp. TaxID=2734609 RepID=UPI003A8B93EB